MSPIKVDDELLLLCISPPTFKIAFYVHLLFKVLFRSVFFFHFFFLSSKLCTAFYPSLLYLLVEILLSGNWKVWVFNVSNERRNISYGVKWNTCSPTFSSKRWPQTWCADFCFPLITAWDAGTKIFVIGEALIFLSNDKVSWSFPILVYFSARLGRLPTATDICHLMCKLWDLLFAMQSFLPLRHGDFENDLFDDNFLCQYWLGEEWE